MARPVGSLGAARQVSEIGKDLAELILSGESTRGGSAGDVISARELISLLGAIGALDQLASRPELKSVLNFRQSPRGVPYEVQIGELLLDWINGCDVYELAHKYLPEASFGWALEQMATAIRDGVQYYLSWFLSEVADGAQEILERRQSNVVIDAKVGLVVRYGTDDGNALQLLARGVTNRRFALAIATEVEGMADDWEELAACIETRGMDSWKEVWGATSLDVRELCVALRDGSKFPVNDFLGDKNVRFDICMDVSMGFQSTPVRLVATGEEDAIHLHTSSHDVCVGTIAPHDHSHVWLILQTGRPYIANLEGNQVVISRSDVPR